MLAKTLTMLEITLPETGNIQFSMNLIAIQNVMTQATLPSFSFLRRTVDVCFHLQHTFFRCQPCLISIQT